MANALLLREGAKTDKLLPYEANSEEEFRAYLLPGIEHLRDLVLNDGPLDEIRDCVHFLKRACDVMIQMPLSTKEMADVLLFLWELVLCRPPDRFFCNEPLLALHAWLRRAACMLEPGDVQLPWRPAYKVWKLVKWVPSRLSGNLVNTAVLEQVITYANRFFTPGSDAEVMAELRPYLCGTDTSLEYACTTLFFFMPSRPHAWYAAGVDCVPWRHEMAQVWEHARRHISSKSACMATLARAIRIGIGRVDLADMRPVIFKQVLRYVRLNPNEPPGRDQSPMFHLSESRAFVWLCLPNDDEFWAFVDDLVHVLEPELHPSNAGHQQQLCANFVSAVIQGFLARRESEMDPRTTIPEHARLKQGDYDRLFDAFKESVLRCLNSKDPAIVQLGLAGAMYMCMLSPRRFVPWVVDQMYSGLESLESHRLIATLLLLSGIPKFLFSPTFVPNGDAHLIPLLHALLPALDVNDPNKSLEAMNVLMEVTQTVTFVDCSNAIPDDASAEEQEAMEATCQIESWLDAFLDTMFELVENMSGLSTPAGWRNASLSFDAMLQGAFMQLSPELANRAVDKTATWLLTRAVNRSNGSIKAVARSAAICNPKRMLDKVLPTLTEKLLDLCAHEATIDEAKREVMGRMTLLVSYLDVWRSIITQLDPAVMEHKDSIMAVFRAVLRLRGQGAVQRAADTLGVLLERLTLPWMPDRSAVTVDDRQGKTDIDPVTMFRRRFYSGMSEDEVTESIFTYKFLKPLVDGTLDPRWRKPTAETRAFAEELVAAFYDDAVAFLRECTTKTSKEAAATVDRDMLRTALSIVECVADTPTVVWPFTADKFDAQEGGIPGAPFKTQPPRHWVEPTCERAHERRGELIEVLTALVPWAMEHRASDVKVLKACVICAQVTLVPSTRAQSRIAGAVGHVGETSTALSRAYLMGMLEELDAARYDMDLVVQPLLATDVPLVQAIVETLRSPLPDVRFVAEHVLLQISDLCWNRGVPLIFDMLLELWDQVRTDPVDDAKHALMGVLALLSTPTMSGWTAQDSGRLLRVYRLLRQCTHFEDQELYDQLNAFAATQCSNLPGFPWPVPHSPSCLQAAHRLPTTARRQNNDKTSKSEAAETEQQQQQEGAGEGRMDTAQDEGGASASGVDAYGRPRRRQSIVQWRREQSHSTQEVMLLALDALKAPDLTWKHKLWFASVAGFLASATETLHPEVVGFLFRNLVSDEPALREGCQVAMVRVLQALKTPVAKVDVRVTQDGDVVEVNGPYCWRRVASIDQPFRGDLADLQQRDQDPSCGGGTGGDGGGGGDGGDGAGNTTPAHQDQQQQQQSSSWSYKHQHFGYRKDTRVVCPKIDPATMQVQDIGEDEVYFDKPFWGWYAWPSVVRTYAPEKYQSFDHFIGRHPAPTEKDTRVGEDGAPVSPCMDVEHMLAASRAVIELELQDPAFLHRLIGFLKEDTFTSLRRVSHLFKGLFRNYGYALVPLVLPDVATLCQSTLRQDHRAAAGVLLGLLRGSKHWPRADKVKMRAEVEPLLEGTLLTMPASVMRAWTALVQLTVCEHDPRRSAWLMNLLLRKYFEPDPTRTALQKNVLGSALSAVLGELSWRARHISRLVMEKAAADVPHAYGLVRQTAVGLIVCGYTALVPTKNPLCTTEATTVTAAAGGVKGGAQGKEASEGGVEDQASSAKGDQADAETEAEIDADEEAQFLAAFTASLMAPLRAAVETTPTTPAAHLGEGKFDVLSEIGVPGEKRAVEAANARGDMATKRAALIAMDTEADGGVADSDAVAVDTRAHRHHRFHHGGPREQHTHRPRPHPHPSSGQPVSPPPGTGEGGEGVVLSVPENVSFEEFQQLMQQQLAQLKIPSDQAQQMMRQMHEQVTRLHHQQQQQQQQHHQQQAHRRHSQPNQDEDFDFDTASAFGNDDDQEGSAGYKSKLAGKRGRRRREIMQAMKPEELERERELKLQKSRQSARECRRRKKQYIQRLEERIRQLEAKTQTQASDLARLAQENAALRTQQGLDAGTPASSVVGPPSPALSSMRASSIGDASSLATANTLNSSTVAGDTPSLNSSGLNSSGLNSSGVASMGVQPERTFSAPHAVPHITNAPPTTATSAATANTATAPQAPGTHVLGRTVSAPTATTASAAPRSQVDPSTLPPSGIMGALESSRDTSFDALPSPLCGPTSFFGVKFKNDQSQQHQHQPHHQPHQRQGQPGSTDGSNGGQHMANGGGGVNTGGSDAPGSTPVSPVVLQSLLSQLHRQEQQLKSLQQQQQHQQQQQQHQQQHQHQQHGAANAMQAGLLSLLQQVQLNTVQAPQPPVTYAPQGHHQHQHQQQHHYAQRQQPPMQQHQQQHQQGQQRPQEHFNSSAALFPLPLDTMPNMPTTTSATAHVAAKTATTTAISTTTTASIATAVTSTGGTTSMPPPLPFDSPSKAALEVELLLAESSDLMSQLHADTSAAAPPQSSA